ncbi:helix-turn-helix domain-containing protein [Deinococcus hopiensis]|uniref:Helix-turn-helix domain-containing protein n=1 Tax=Deinococcus hopiensis KR-140 TaxID=695939 RepID=A0A1W1US78_9DEIO|nr:helix-turn-helix domain-containing protein [Deinococcus hopiensis]SMB83947.1 Helix-turn-helix domain-containing protein [Deinococcus hopiensis KR-140]
MSPDRTFTVESVRAATFLADPEQRRFIEPFLGRECTVQRAAVELRVTPNSVLYRVRRMVSLGLVEVVREEARAGRAVRIYRSVADRFFVPYRCTAATDLLEILLSERLAFEEVLQRAMLRVMREMQGEHNWGMLLYRKENGVHAYDAIQPEEPWSARSAEEPAVLDHALTVGPLTRCRAKALQLDLLNVLARHTREAGEDVETKETARYLVRLALAPLPSLEER